MILVAYSHYQYSVLLCLVLIDLYFFLPIDAIVEIDLLQFMPNQEYLRHPFRRYSNVIINDDL